MSYCVPPWNNRFSEVYADKVYGDVIGNVSGNANTNTMIAKFASIDHVFSVTGNIGNVRFSGGNVSASGQVNVLANVVAGNFIGNVISAVGNIGNVRFVGGNIFSSSVNGISGWNTVGSANFASLSTTFTGTILKTVANTLPNTTYNHITCSHPNGNVFRVSGDGQTFGGTYNTSGADYAEFFEWADKNEHGYDRRGKTVVLTTDGKIRLSTHEDDPYSIFGIVSTNPSIIGDAQWDHWAGKYVTDKFGKKVSNVLYFLSNVFDISENIRCSPETDPPEGYVITASDNQDWLINPDYNEEKTYVPRTNRLEWDCIGLIGKLRVLPSQPVNPSWHFMRKISCDDGIVHEYLLTSGVNSNVMSELTSLKSEIETIKTHLGINK